MPVMSTKTSPLQLEYRDRAVRSFYQEAADKIPVVWNKIFQDLTTDKKWVQDVPMGGLGPYNGAEENEAVTYDALVEGSPATYVLTKFHSGCAWTEEAEWYNTIWPLLKAGTEALAVSRMHTEEIIHADLFNSGFGTTKYTGGDGKALFAADHPMLRADAGYVSLASSFRNRPAIDHPLSEAGLEQATIDIRKMPDESGFFSSVEPDVLVIPTEREFDVTRIQKSMGRTNTADNDTNALRALGILQKDPIVWKYLTSTSAWFVLNRAFSGPGLKSYRHRKADPTPKTWIDNATGNTLVRSRFTRALGWSNPRSAYGCPGA